MWVFENHSLQFIINYQLEHFMNWTECWFKLLFQGMNFYNFVFGFVLFCFVLFLILKHLILLILFIH